MSAARLQWNGEHTSHLLAVCFRLLSLGVVSKFGDRVVGRTHGLLMNRLFYMDCRPRLAHHGSFTFCGWSVLG